MPISPSSANQIPRKRPIAIHNNTLPPAVSFVLAQPQQAQSLASAVSRLPTILRRAMPPNSHQSFTTSTNQNHDKSYTDDNTSSPPPVIDHESNQSLLDPTPAVSPVLTADRVSLALHSDHASPSPHPLTSFATTSEDPLPAMSLSKKRSWFNVFWLNDKATSFTEVKIEVDAASNTPDAVPVRTPSSNNISGPHTTTELSATAGAPGNSSPRSAVLSFSNDIPSQAPSSESAPHLEFSHVDALPFDHDDSAHQFMPDALPTCSAAPRALEVTSPPAVTDPPPGMLSFGFPMLVKSRPPPETAIKSSPPKPPVEPREPTSPTSDPRSITFPMNGTQPAHTTSTSNLITSECPNQSSPTRPTAVTEARTNVWWTYLGWSGSSSAAEAEPSAQCMGSMGAHRSSAAPEQPYIPDTFEDSLPEGETMARMDSSLDGSVKEHLMSHDSKPSSVHHPDAASVASGTAWYAPWSWYQSSTPIATTAPGKKSGLQPDPPVHSQMPSQAEEEPATGDHGAQRPPYQPSPSSHDASTAESVDYNNPIQAAISANPTGWMSFFTAKAISMKSITYEKEGKMEVMEIDDEMAPDLNSAHSSARTVTQPSPTQFAKSPVRAQPQMSGVPPSSSPPPTISDDKRSHIPRAVTNPETVVHDVLKRQPSPSPSKKSSVKTPTSPPPPNLVLPTWNDTFYTLPRSAVPREPPSVLSKTLQYVSGVLFSRDEASSNKGKARAKEPAYSPYDKALPRTWDVVSRGEVADILKGCKKVVIIGVHGWFPGTVLRTLAGEPTGTSSKFVNGISDALDCFQEEHKVKLDKVTKIPLEGEGTINRRVERLYQNLIGNKEWMDDLHDADAIFIATHSQGSVVSTHLLDRLIADQHIRTNANAFMPASGVASSSATSARPPQRICCLALCGIHLGPLRYLGTSSLVQPYIQYFESTAARELFEFQNTESAISRDYVRALRNVLHNGIKMVYIASLNDQVVGLYSGLFTSVSHPLILRALYIDGDAYHSSDFLSNLLVLLLRIRNAGLSDGGLLTHLSEVTAGSLNGVGHSTPYEERSTYSLAVNYLFLTDDGSGTQVEFVEEPFNALAERNDYEIPWALRDLIADDKVAGLFSDEIVALRDAFRDWHPRTSILRDVKRKLQPIQRLSSALITTSQASKL